MKCQLRKRNGPHYWLTTQCGCNILVIMAILTITSTERKSRMPHIRGIKGKDVVNHCEPLITKEIPA